MVTILVDKPTKEPKSMSNSYKNSSEQLVGTSDQKGRIKSFLSRAHRSNIKQELPSHRITDVPTEDVIEDIEERIDIAENRTRMQHKFVGSIDVLAKAQEYADAHGIDLEKAFEITYHRAIGK